MVAYALPGEFELLSLINRADQARASGRIAQADRLLLLAWMAYDGAAPAAANPVAAPAPP